MFSIDILGYYCVNDSRTPSDCFFLTSFNVADFFFYIAADAGSVK